MELSIDQAYLAIFYMLDKYYEQNKHDDDLGALLGSLNPYLFEGDIPADKAAWEDWTNCVSKVTLKNILSVKESLQAVLLFLQFYQDKYGFNLGWIIKELRNKKEINVCWNEGIQKVDISD